MGLFSFLFPRIIVQQHEKKNADNNELDVRYPFYIKAPAVLLGLCLFIYILVVLQDILVPVCFATLIAMLLNPVVNKLVKWRIPKPLSIALALLVAIAAVAGLMYFLGSQISNFSDMVPQLKQRSSQLLAQLQRWLETTFNFGMSKQNAALKDAEKSIQPFLTGFLGSMVGVIGVFVLLPVYIFLILYYKPLFLNFFYEVFEDRDGDKVSEILSETKNAIQSYITGLLIEMCIVAALNSTALLILGVKYALLIGVIGAILNIVPYIGGLIAIALPIIISLVSGGDGLTTPLLIVGAYLVIQFIDNNFLVPKIVSSKVDVNAFVSIIIVLMGGAMWGVSGMFLSIPFIAICKIIFDRVKPLKPWGKLLGVKIDENPPQNVVNKEDAGKAKDNIVQ